MYIPCFRHSLCQIANTRTHTTANILGKTGLNLQVLCCAE